MLFFDISLTVNSKPPTIPFRIVACTSSNNHSRNSCISRKENVEESSFPKLPIIKTKTDFPSLLLKFYDSILTFFQSPNRLTYFPLSQRYKKWILNLTEKWITSSSLTEPPVDLLCKLSINCPSASELCKTNKLSWQLPFNSIQNRVNWIQTEYIDSSISLIHYADSTTHLFLMMF